MLNHATVYRMNLMASLMLSAAVQMSLLPLLSLFACFLTKFVG